MFVLKGKTAYFDVDDTLVLWKDVSELPLFSGRVLVFTDKAGKEWKAKPHERHVRELISHARRGHNIVVWSAGGAEWAERAVKALGLQEYVDAILDKPDWHYDDLDSTHFMNDRKFYDDDKDEE